MAASMEIDAVSSSRDLTPFDIYTDDDFPLVVRTFIDPILMELKLADMCLDLESSDPEVRNHVDKICNEAFNKINRLNQDSNCSSYQVRNFLRKFDDGRSFFKKLTEKLEIERSLLHKEDLANIYMQIKNKKMAISNSVSFFHSEGAMSSF